MNNEKIIAVDFDGTLCENEYPEIGEPNNNIIDYVKGEKQNGAKLILWTCRAGVLLDEAVKWCTQQGLIFDAVNENLPEVIEKFGGDTRKIFADEYIDDKNNITIKLKQICGSITEVVNALIEYIKVKDIPPSLFQQALKDVEMLRK